MALGGSVHYYSKMSYAKTLYKIYTTRDGIATPVVIQNNIQISNCARDADAISRIKDFRKCYSKL